MSTVEFHYQNYRIFIYCREDEKMITICHNYCFKIQLDFNLVDFIYEGKKVNLELTFSEQINEKDRISKTMKIIVLQKSQIIPSKLVCPECREIISIEIKDYKINLFGCKNGHQINNLSFKDYQDKISKIHIENICCDNCKESNYLLNNQIFKCFSCKQNLCSKCRLIHDGDHYLINNGMKNYICPEHNNERFISYCGDCKKNLCFLCENDHENHNIIIFRKIIHQKEDYNKHFSKLKENIEVFQKNINEINKIFIKVIEQIKLYEKIYEDILNNNFLTNRNYIIFKNLNEFYNSSIIEDINNINKDNNIVSKFDKIMNIYNKIIDGNNKDKEENKIKKETKVIKKEETNKKDLKGKENKIEIKEINKEEIKEKEQYNEIIKDIINKMIKKIEKDDEIKKEKEKNKKAKIPPQKKCLRNDNHKIMQKRTNKFINEIGFYIDNRTIKINNTIITVPSDKEIRKANTKLNNFNGFLTPKVYFPKYLSEDNIDVKGSLGKNNIILKRNTSSNAIKNKQFNDYFLLNDTTDIFESKKLFDNKFDYSNNSD